MHNYGYIRVSTKEQHTDRQRAAILEFGVPAANIFEDKQSGKDFERPAWEEMCGTLERGDVLVVKSIDRLGRNYREILEQWRVLTEEKEAAIVVLDMPLLDTRSRRDLMGTLISDIVLQLLSYVAETERSMIHTRQAEGIAAAKARGVRFGRTAKPIPPEFEPLYIQWRAKDISRQTAAERMGVTPAAFYRMVQRYENRV